MKRILLLLPANNKAGVQKIAANLARSLSLSGWVVFISYPILPYHRVYGSKKNYRTLLGTWKRYLLQFVTNPNFKFSEIIDDVNVKHRPFLVKPGQRYLQSFDQIVAFGEYLLPDLYTDDLAAKSNLYILHPLEIVHKNPQYLRPIIKGFKGKTMALSPFTQNWLRTNLNLDVPVLLPALSKYFWPVPLECRDERKYDFLINYIPSTNKGIDLVERFIRKITEIAPDKKIGVFASFTDVDRVQQEFPNYLIHTNVPEQKMPKLFSMYKFFLYPSRLEGFGMSPLEAIACATVPIMIPGVGALDLFGVDGKNTIFFAEEEIEAVAIECVNILNKDGEIQKYQHNCTQTDFNRFSPDTYAQRLLDIIGEPNHSW